MKQFLLIVNLLLLAILLNAQTPTATWGSPFTIKKGEASLQIIEANKDGVFAKESHYIKGGFFNNKLTEVATLIKCDNDLNQTFTNDFSSELKDKAFDRFFSIKNKLYLLATTYNKNNMTLALLSAEVNKNSGALASDWVEITSWTKAEKDDDIDYQVSYNYDKTKMVVVSSITGKAKSNYELKVYSENMISAGGSLSINEAFETDLSRLEDIVYTSAGNIVLVKKIMEYKDGKSKKTKNLYFKKYNISIYDKTGKLIKEINTEIEGKYITSTKVMQIENKDLVLAAFYSNTKGSNEVNGIFVQRINATKGDIISTAKKEISTQQITKVANNNPLMENETAAESIERQRLEWIQKNEYGFNKFMQIRNFIYCQDKGIVIIAEEYARFSYTNFSNNYGGIVGIVSSASKTYEVIESGDILMCKVKLDGNLDWLHVLPKYQREVNLIGLGSGVINFNSYFNPANTRPFYSGMAMVQKGNIVNIIFNDSDKNLRILQPGQTPARVSKFLNTDCFNVALQTSTGSYSRNKLFSNGINPTAMPRLGSVLNNNLYLIGKEDKVGSKTKVALARLSF